MRKLIMGEYNPKVEILWLGRSEDSWNNMSSALNLRKTLVKGIAAGNLVTGGNLCVKAHAYLTISRF